MTALAPSPSPSSPTLTRGYTPGIIAEMIALQMAYYGPAWRFGVRFEAGLAREIGAFVERYDPLRDLLLAARGPDGILLGTITVDGHEDDAHLRWFIVGEGARGTGLGRTLMAAVVGHLDAHGRGCTLTTFRGLDAALALYERHGFRLVSEGGTDPWSGSVRLLRYARPRPA